MKNFYFFVLMSFSLMVASLPDATNRAHAENVPRQINITSNSKRGWFPSLEYQKSVEAAAKDFFEKFDSRKFEDAYDMLAENFQQNATRQQFIGYGEKVAFDTEKIISREFVKTTWTKDPSNGPFDGIFVALDFSGKYAKAKRYCGYIVLYQAPFKNEFKVMRVENNYLVDTMAREIATTKSQKALNELWAQMSRSCPNYKAQ